jgi:TolA-binding protein
MSRRINLVIVLALSSSIGLAQSSQPASPPKTSVPATQTTDERRETDSVQQANRQDLQKMRAILNQMRTNLAFVGSTTTPLNHQFQLEIDMWQALLDQMERRNDGKDRKP